MHQVLTYANDNVQNENINTIQKNPDSLLEISLAVNAQKTKHTQDKTIT
jgi:hypothetical protein